MKVEKNLCCGGVTPSSKRYLKRLPPSVANLWILIPLVLAGCSYSFVDRQGNLHVIGFIHITEKIPDKNSTSIAGHVKELETLGFSIHSDQETSSISIGYSRDVRAYIKNHALVIGNPAQEIQ